MRKVLLLAAAICLATVATAHAAADKLAVFNSRAVAAKCQPFVDAQKKLESQYGPEKKRLDAEMKKLNDQADALQKQRTALSREAFGEKSDSFMRSKRNLEDKLQTYARKVEGAAVRINQEFTQRLMQGVQAYGARQRYAAVLDAASAPVVLYFDKSVDVTDDIIKEVARMYREKPAGK